MSNEGDSSVVHCRNLECKAEIQQADRFCRACGWSTQQEIEKKPCILCQNPILINSQECIICSAPQNPQILSYVPRKQCQCGAILMPMSQHCYRCSTVQPTNSQKTLQHQTQSVVHENEGQRLWDTQPTELTMQPPVVVSTPMAAIIPTTVNSLQDIGTPSSEVDTSMQSSEEIFAFENESVGNTISSDKGGAVTRETLPTYSIEGDDTPTVDSVADDSLPSHNLQWPSLPTEQTPLGNIKLNRQEDNHNMSSEQTMLTDTTNEQARKRKSSHDETTQDDSNDLPNSKKSAVDQSYDIGNNTDSLASAVTEGNMEQEKNVQQPKKDFERQEDSENQEGNVQQPEKDFERLEDSEKQKRNFQKPDKGGAVTRVTLPTYGIEGEGATNDAALANGKEGTPPSSNNTLRLPSPPVDEQSPSDNRVPNLSDQGHRNTNSQAVQDHIANTNEQSRKRKCTEDTIQNDGNFLPNSKKPPSVEADNSGDTSLDIANANANTSESTTKDNMAVSENQKEGLFIGGESDSEPSASPPSPTVINNDRTEMKNQVLTLNNIYSY